MADLMKPDELKKYNAAYPPPEPKHGRFSPNKQFFLCSTQDEIAKLETLGWGTNPLEFDVPYSPEEAAHRPMWKDIDFNAKPAVAAPDLSAELAAARARIAELEAAPPRSRKVPA
jgi:hypothetical protein